MSRLRVLALISITLLVAFLLVGMASVEGPPPGVDPEQPRYYWGPYDPSKMREAP